MVTSKEKLIKGRLYTVELLPAFQSLDLLEELSVTAGPALGALLRNGMAGSVDFQSAAVQLFRGLGGGRLRALAKLLLTTTSVEIAPGKKPNVLDVFDMEYRGKLMEAFLVMAFAAEVQFADFFDVPAAKAAIRTFLTESSEPQSAGPTT